MNQNQQTDSPEITVVVCAFNAEKYLKKSLDSLLTQTYPRIKIIVIDDGSIDATPNIIRQYQERGRIHAEFLSPNRGTAYVRQKGLDLVQTDLMMFFDADDIALPGLVDKQVGKILEDEKCIAVGSYAYYIGPDDDAKRLAIQAIGVTNKIDFFQRFNDAKIYYTTPFTLFKRAYALKAGGYRQEGFEEYHGIRLQDISEDVDLWSRMADFGRHGYFMLTIPEGLVLYRKMPGTLSARNSVWMGRKLRWIKNCVQNRRKGRKEKRFHNYISGLGHREKLMYFLEDSGGYCYKSFTFKVLEKKYIQAFLWVGTSFLLSPGFVLKKLKTQLSIPSFLNRKEN